MDTGMLKAYLTINLGKKYEAIRAKLTRDGGYYSGSSKERVNNPGPQGGLTESERDRLSSRSFAVPETRSWPIHDQRHALKAINYMERGFGSREDYEEVESAIASKYSHDSKVMKALNYYRKYYK
jgi:hypothetical protein